MAGEEKNTKGVAGYKGISWESLEGWMCALPKGGSEGLSSCKAVMGKSDRIAAMVRGKRKRAIL